MKLLIVALCLAGPNLFIRCASRQGNVTVSRRADWAVPDLKIGGSSQVLEFGGRGRFIAAANNVLGTGAYGTVYKGLDRLNGHAVAIKTENSRHPPCLLPNEIKYYLLLDEQLGIPRIFYSGSIGQRIDKIHVLVMELLGNSLARLQQDSGGKFSPKTVYMIGIQLMQRIKGIHEKGLLHRDIKPENMGVGAFDITKLGHKDTRTLIYVYDLGLSAKYLDENGRHVRAGGETGGAGTPRYMSAYAHGHGTQSRRDDLESIGFLLMSFLRGNLPWDALPIGEYFRPPAESKVVQMKKNLDFDNFCWGFSKHMAEYFEYVRRLQFDGEPDYLYLTKLFRKSLVESGETEDFKFDWTYNQHLKN